MKEARGASDEDVSLIRSRRRNERTTRVSTAASPIRSLLFDVYVRYAYAKKMRCEEAERKEVHLCGLE